MIDLRKAKESLGTLGGGNHFIEIDRVCTGLGNEDWNHSAPHGAGRVMSRKEAKDSITLSSVKDEMQGIFTTSLDKDTIDEAPGVYKPMDEIVSHIADTVTVDKVIKPVYNFKAGENVRRKK